jgi:hypothetical protein
MMQSRALLPETEDRRAMPSFNRRYWVWLFDAQRSRHGLGHRRSSSMVHCDWLSAIPTRGKMTSTHSFRLSVWEAIPMRSKLFRLVLILATVFVLAAGLWSKRESFGQRLLAFYVTQQTSQPSSIPHVPPSGITFPFELVNQHVMLEVSVNGSRHLLIAHPAASMSKPKAPTTRRSESRMCWRTPLQPKRGCVRTTLSRRLMEELLRT